MSSLLQKSTYIRPDFYLDLFLRKSGGFFAGGVIVISFNNETFFPLNSFHSKKKLVSISSQMTIKAMPSYPTYLFYHEAMIVLVFVSYDKGGKTNGSLV
jgi:hypothetical protein